MAARVAVDDEAMIRMTRGGWQRRKESSSRRKARPVLPLCGSALRGGKITADEQVVIFNTGSGIKYLECYEA